MSAVNCCPKCGGNFDERSPCPTCFYSAMPQAVILVCEHSGQSISLRISTTIGQHRLKAMFEDEWKYASEEQFRIVRDEEAREWILYNSDSAKNPTYCNGTPVPSDGIPLSDSDKISIGGKAAILKVQL